MWGESGLCILCEEAVLIFNMKAGCLIDKYAGFQEELFVRLFNIYQLSIVQG